MTKNIRPIILLAALAVLLAVGVMAQQKSGDTAVDPVCGMTVVRANAKGTFDYKGTTYYFCSTGCKEAFAKDPEKYLAAQTMGGEKAAPMAMMRHGAQMGHASMPEGGPMAGCPMMARRMPMRGRMGRMGMMPGGMMTPGLGQLFRLYGDRIQVDVENAKDGAALKITSKDPEVVKAIQVHMAEHIAMMKKMKDAAATAPAAGVKSPEAAACADCPMKKK